MAEAKVRARTGAAIVAFAMTSGTRGSVGLATVAGSRMTYELAREQLMASPGL
eukprot:CAMPEP_0171094100 /NCGR_PEP_ID=MMETSP0766_2-20121228/39919_1 /TAXON_ID=439317 /ORGANISM="Gambierdiscus australes, Strain CAWD 149" /LENGTH=52 /DNA_ID=CAMNT_0011552661 /DNA_START=344 /DNA_END=502 /DNA_ORIENTATION=+